MYPLPRIIKENFHLNNYFMSIRKSKMVKCDMCDLWVHSRGLHSHMRQIHHIVIETRTKVVEPDLNRTIVAEGGDLSHPTKVVEQVTSFKKVELVPDSRGGKVKMGSNYMPIYSDQISIPIRMGGSVEDWIDCFKRNPHVLTEEWEKCKNLSEEKCKYLPETTLNKHKALKQIFESKI